MSALLEYFAIGLTLGALVDGVDTRMRERPLRWIIRLRWFVGFLVAWPIAACRLWAQPP